VQKSGSAGEQKAKAYKSKNAKEQKCKRAKVRSKKYYRREEQGLSAFMRCDIIPHGQL